MILDRCKPLNEGEGETVRIVMTLPEARRILLESRDAAFSAVPPRRALLELHDALYPALRGNR